MSAIESSPIATISTIACSIAYDAASLYKLFDQILTNDQTDSIIKESLEITNQKIYKKFKDTDSYFKILEMLPLNDLIRELKINVYKVNCKKVREILATKKIPADSDKLKDICVDFRYSSTTDELAHEMLKMLIDYGFNWRYDDIGACIYSIDTIEFPKVIELLLDSGLDVNTKLAKNLGSLIEYSAKHKRNDVSKLLIERGATVDDMTKAKLPTHLQTLLDERSAKQEQVTDKTVVKTISKMCTDEAQVLSKLHQEVNKITGDPKFEKNEIKIIDIYHRFVHKFVIQYNASNPYFVVAFDSVKAILTVQWKI